MINDEMKRLQRYEQQILAGKKSLVKAEWSIGQPSSFVLAATASLSFVGLSGVVVYQEGEEATKEDEEERQTHEQVELRAALRSAHGQFMTW